MSDNIDRFRPPTNAELNAQLSENIRVPDILIRWTYYLVSLLNMSRTALGYFTAPDTYLQAICVRCTSPSDPAVTSVPAHRWRQAAIISQNM